MGGPRGNSSDFRDGLREVNGAHGARGDDLSRIRSLHADAGLLSAKLSFEFRSRDPVW